MSVWITRSAPDNLRTARELHALGHRPLVVPVVTTVPRPQSHVIVLPDAVVFTSLHAVRHYANHDALASLPVFAASGAVAAAAASAGYTTVTSTGEDDAMLCRLVAHVLPAGAQVLLACGSGTTSTISDRLSGRGCSVSRAVAYDTIALPDDALTAATRGLDRIGAIVVHSRSGGETIAPLLRRARWRGTLWCISERAAEACDAVSDATVRVAACATEGSLLEMIASAATTTPRRQPTRAHTANAAMMSIRRTGTPFRRSVATNDDEGCERWSDDDPDPTAA